MPFLHAPPLPLVQGCLGFLRAIGKVFGTNGVPEWLFEFQAGTYTQNMTHTRVLFNKGVAWEALLRQKPLPWTRHPVGTRQICAP